MKKQLFSLAFVALAGVANAQNENPYAAFGYEGTVLTTPQERQKVILMIENSDTLSPIRRLGIDPAKHHLYYFSAANALIGRYSIGRRLCTVFVE